MKKMMLGFLVVVFLLGFVIAEDNQTLMGNDSAENGTLAEDLEIVLSDVVGNEVVLNDSETVDLSDEEVNESVEAQLGDDLALNESEDVEVEVDDVVTGDLEIVDEKDSPLDSTISYFSGVVDKVNSVYQNLFWVLLIFVVLLIMFLHTVFFGDKSSAAYFAKASKLHRKAQVAHVDGNYDKAKRLYEKSYSFREKGEKQATLEGE